jgi:hypothetical protein
VNTSVMTIPMIRPRTVNSVRGAALDGNGALTNNSPRTDAAGKDSVE